jgi:hypothetical protein
MAGKVKIVRVLANPISKRTKSAKIKRRKNARQKKVRSVSGKWVLRRVGRAPGSGATWWNGKNWVPARASAKSYPSADAAGRALRAARGRAGSNWAVLDVMPA